MTRCGTLHRRHPRADISKLSPRDRRYEELRLLDKPELLKLLGDTALSKRDPQFMLITELLEKEFGE